MRPFAYYEPRTLDEAVALLGQADGPASVLAGGTDLLVEIKEGLRRVDHVVNIKRIPDLTGLRYDDTDGLRFGALTTTREIETSPLVRAHYPNLAQAVSALGSVQVRNRATVAGNICRASPSADTPPPLIADGASVRLVGPSGERTLPLEDFFVGPGKTVLGQGELVVEFSVPAPPPHTGQVYLKHGRRAAMELATVGVAVTLTLADGVCCAARVVLGAVAPIPLRARQAEAVLRGRVVDEGVVEAAAEAAMAEARPISDVRASADYRREMVRVLTARATRRALALARA